MFERSSEHKQGFKEVKQSVTRESKKLLRLAVGESPGGGKKDRGRKESIFLGRHYKRAW